VFASPGNQKTLRGAPVSLNTSGFASSGTGGYTYAASGLPSWLSINASSGVITGTAPTADSTTTGIILTLTDATGATASTPPFAWSVYAAPTVTAPANQASSVGTSVNLALASTCPNSPCTFALNTGAPPGLSISNTGVITGTITGASKNYPAVAVTITDAGGTATSSATFSWLVNPAPRIVSPGNQKTLHSATVSLDMSAYASGGTGKYAYTAAHLPTWLSINATTGVISGIAPTGADTVTTAITVTLTDATNASSTTATFTWTLNNILTISVPNQSTYKSSAMSLDLHTATTGGTGPYTYTASGLPSWVSLNPSTGVLTGTAPSVPLNTSTVVSGIKVTVTDSFGTVIQSAAFNWYVTDLIWIGSGANGSSFSTQHGTSVNGQTANSFVAGGSGARTFLAVGLPTGVSVAADGTITGTASTVGTWHATLLVTDSVGATSRSAITWTVT
jgi:hypothetical protein